jgi:hypothetical protein
LPDSQEVKTLIDIAGKDLSRLYSEQMGGNNKTGFNLLPAGYYNPYFTNLLSNKKIKTCFWIRLDDVSNPNKLFAYCFYFGENDIKAGVEGNVDAETSRLPIRLIYNKDYCLTH